MRNYHTCLLRKEACKKTLATELHVLSMVFFEFITYQLDNNVKKLYYNNKTFTFSLVLVSNIRILEIGLLITSNNII